MAIGKIAFPGFTGSHSISTLPVRYGHLSAVEVITSQVGNTIKRNDAIPPSGEDKNFDNEVVRKWYTGRTNWYFLQRSTNRPFGIMIENTGTGNVNNVQVHSSLTGLIWDSITNSLTVSLGQNQGYSLSTVGGALADGWYILYHITCASTAKVSVQCV